MREALQDVPAQVEEFVSLLNKFEQVGDGQEVVLLFRRLQCIMGDRIDLLRDFAAFLQPEQALQCGLVSTGGAICRVSDLMYFLWGIDYVCLCSGRSSRRLTAAGVSCDS